MTLLACVTVDAKTALGELIERIASEPESMYVVIRRSEGSEIYWYIWTVEDVRIAAQRWASSSLDASLTDALILHEYEAVDHFDSRRPGDLSGEYGVLVRGAEAVGVLRPESSTRGGRGPTRGDTLMSAGGGAATARSDVDRKPFSSYPALTAPESVGSQQEFDLVIGLSATPIPGVAGGPLTIIAPPEFTFDLQVVADGFSFPEGSKAVLEVVRDDFQEAKATVKMIATEVPGGSVSQGTLEVLFFYEGNLCGRALRMIAVGGAPRTEAPVTVEGAASVSIPDVPPPDLTVNISRGSDDKRLLWTLATADGIDGPFVHEFDTHSAKTFALDRIRSLADWDKNPLSAAKLVGIAEEISRTMPNEFWLALDVVWKKKQESGQSAPSVLIVSEDPYVPWELAATTARFARPERLDAGKPPFLGAQVRVGRWIPPDETPFGGDVPTLPPTTAAEVNDMVLFIGDYAAINGQRELPLAIEEGNKLAVRYGAIRRQAVINDVADLVNDTVFEGAEKVKIDAIHFACHGEVSANPRHNGIVLSDRNVRLGADMISGSAIGTTSNPFVFLNACQLGTETEGLDGNYGGLAGAFLDQGATGFISPLWSVDDDIAQEVALDFYKRVYDTADPAPVAEVMSDLRSRFDMQSSSPRASYLAYVYYGHPDLIINKIEEASNGDT